MLQVPTLRVRGAREVCLVCYWDDDARDEEDADAVTQLDDARPRVRPNKDSASIARFAV
jgi:hypothetical protein